MLCVTDVIFKSSLLGFGCLISHITRVNLFSQKKVYALQTQINILFTDVMKCVLILKCVYVCDVSFVFD